MLSRKRRPAFPDLYFGTTKLAVVTDLSILGGAVDVISKNVGQRIGALRRIANKLDTAGRATVCKAQIRSMMEHACLSPHLKRTPSHSAEPIDGGRKRDQGLLHLNLAIFWFENQLQSLF